MAYTCQKLIRYDIDGKYEQCEQAKLCCLIAELL